MRSSIASCRVHRRDFEDRHRADPQSDLRLNTPELRVDVNRDKLGDLGIPVETVGHLQTMLGGSRSRASRKTASSTT